MRLDKFLKVSRLVKRRTVAKEICDGGKVLINGKTAKAGSEVAEGNIITISFGARHIKVEVAAILESVRAEKAKEMYRVLEDVKVDLDG
ncbi:MAG: RNA-binding S4 domain-containing protein [Desulfitobacteriaceae bacterium]|nr:RNA-binding S4 domain-containing protein [Desulfitobacteriaceae bacterium]MDD4752087.1 RNA-binding S4 domain-containing protein [Desulfitobacteriaceae bacterium]